MTSTDDNMYFFNCHIKHEMVGIPPKGMFPGEHCRLNNLQFLIAAERQARQHTILDGDRGYPRVHSTQSFASIYV